MATSGILGLLFEIDADPSKAQEAIAAFEKQTGAALKNVSDTAAGSAVGFRGMQGEIFSTRESARLLSEEFGLHLPQAVTGAMSNVKGLNEALMALGPVMLGAFALAEIPKFLHGIDEMSKAVAGSSKQIEQAAASAVQTEQRGLDFALRLEQFGIADTRVFTGLRQLMLDTVPPVQVLGASEQQLKIVQQELHRLMPQLTAEHLKQNAQRIAEVPAIQAAIEKLGLEKHAREELIALIGREMGATIRTAATESAAARQVAEAWEDVARMHGQLASSLERAEGATIRFGAAYMRAMALTENAANQAVIAQGISLAGMIRGRRLAAGIEAAWETAKGIAALAEWDFRGAALHFMSAAEYGIIAGTGSRHAPMSSIGARAGERALGPGGEPLAAGHRQLATREAGGGGTTVIYNIQGHVFAGREFAEFTATHLNDFVDNCDGELHASRVKDSTLTRDSLYD